MSSKGNRSNPNHTRTAGHPDTPVESAAQSSGPAGATHQESRDQPQQHSPAEEKR
jgi:hypothetical protein